VKYDLRVFYTFVIIIIVIFASMVVGFQSSAQDARLDPMMSASWEVITFSGNGTIRRTKTPGGWLVTSNASRGGNIFLVYVPDDNHIWLKSSKQVVK
jgi:hypothetical protein